eukprot:759124-Hanusia_phi.AAC.4
MTFNSRTMMKIDGWWSYMHDRRFNFLKMSTFYENSVVSNNYTVSLNGSLVPISRRTQFKPQTGPLALEMIFQYYSARWKQLQYLPLSLSCQATIRSHPVRSSLHLRRHQGHQLHNGSGPLPASLTIVSSENEVDICSARTLEVHEGIFPRSV